MAKKRTNKDSLYEDEFSTKDLAKNIVSKPIKVSGKNERQIDFIKLISDNEIIICSGAAGTGKSYLSVSQALKLLLSGDNKFNKIWLSRPVIETGKSMGFLPGTMEEKLLPYIQPLLDNIDKIIGESARVRLMEAKVIEFSPLAFIRGKTIDNAIVIMDEAQNATPSEMKALLTRIGEDAKFIISGDIDQSDLFKNVEDSGLFDMLNKLKDLDGIALFEFRECDIVRNPIISEILKRYK